MTIFYNKESDKIAVIMKDDMGEEYLSVDDLDGNLLLREFLKWLESRDEFNEKVSFIIV